MRDEHAHMTTVGHWFSSRCNVYDGNGIHVIRLLPILAKFEINTINNGFVLVIPRAEAIITCYQGYLMLNGRKWGAILRQEYGEF